GFLGFAFAVYLLRSRMLMLTGLALAGILTYLLIAIAGLSVIPRYLMLPSLVACIGVAFCLVGWVGLTGAARKVGIGLAILALAVIGVRSTAYLHEGQQLNTSTLEASVKFDRINRILEGRKLAPALKTCLPVISPTHEAVPVIRYRLGLAKEQVLSSTQTESVPKRGIQLLPTGYLVPLGMTSVDKVLRKPWTNFAYPGFVYQGENRAWVAYTSCRATG
ncbi:MAG TPA: hypothetical protein VGO97_02250, partial [Solirubrobacterales bacterium]|nr:hypothetical protein [Solirubrobacterales bacterium]